MYKRARAAAKVGELVKDVPWRDMVVRTATIEDMYFKEIAEKKRLIVRIRFHVGSGTYIRSLAEELGRHLGYPAYLFSLRRTRVGEFTLAEARALASF
jgi:tRNA pseudouridine55 synthase